MRILSNGSPSILNSSSDGGCSSIEQIHSSLHKKQQSSKIQATFQNSLPRRNNNINLSVISSGDGLLNQQQIFRGTHGPAVFMNTKLIEGSPKRQMNVKGGAKIKNVNASLQGTFDMNYD